MSVLRPTAYATWASGPSGYVVQPIQADANQGFLPTGIARSSYANWLWGIGGQWNQYLDEARIPRFWGDASDGIATLSGATTYARDMFYLSLNIASGATLNTGNFRVHADVVTNVGTVHCDGANATGIAAGVAVAGGSLPGGANGGTGGIAISASVGQPGVSVSDSIGGRGATGGSGAGALFGAGGVASALPANYGNVRSLPVALTGQAQGQSGGVAAVRPLRGGAGGGGGGPDGGTNNGGGGGAGGGNVHLIARKIDNASGLISAVGGRGATGLGANAGGGGGGGGGGVYLTTLAYLGPTGPSALSVRGGGGGPGGGGVGAAGSTGVTGSVTLYSPF